MEWRLEVKKVDYNVRKTWMISPLCVIHLDLIFRNSAYEYVIAFETNTFI